MAKSAKAPAKKAAPAQSAKKAESHIANIGTVVTGAKGTIIEMIARKDGASAAEIAKKLGWVRAGATISRAIRLAPFKIRKERGVDGELRYFRA